MASNLPPGCSSPDGGIDHALEAAIEGLCMDIETPEEAQALHEMLPALREVMQTQYRLGSADGRIEVEQHLDQLASDVRKAG